MMCFMNFRAFIILSLIISGKMVLLHIWEQTTA